NGRRGKTITGPNKRPLKSLSDMLKGKQGRFRQNLLGKRVDYSGRSVIVVGPTLRLHQCGLPKKMALELFKPFIYNKLEERGYVTTIKSAKKLVEKEKPEVWDILEEVITEHPVMLNRAPTLHRLGIQAFEPVLIEGKAIRLHPLVCTAFNADFDGDQMAVHVPLSVEAQMETRVLMMSTNNILSPASGRPIINPTQDIVLGLYYMTREKQFGKGEYHEGQEKDGVFTGIFASSDEVRMAYDQDMVGLHSRIRYRYKGEIYDTTVGRVLVSDVLPPGMEFPSVNKVLDKKSLSALIDECYRASRNKNTVLLADRLRTLGFEMSTRAGISICMDDMIIPDSKAEVLDEAQQDVATVVEQYQEGLITDGERYNKVVDIWAEASDQVARDLMESIGTDEVTDPETGEKTEQPSFNSIFMMADSGARGSNQQIRQLAGMRGLMAKPSGEIIETPITANFREGLTVLQYFISTHGARKGLADTALKTANSGYLTRRLVDVAQDAVITDYDCETLDGIWVSKLEEGGEVVTPLGERVLGRVALEDITDPVTDEALVEANQEINEARVARIEAAGIERVLIRSVLTCQNRRGVCVMCYGRDLGRGYEVNIGEAVGIIGAQSIGEPGTQLTMRTFHIGGAAARGKIEQSSIQSRSGGTVKFDNANMVTKDDGTVVVMNRHGAITIIDESGREREHFTLTYGAFVKVKEGDRVERGAMLAEWDPYAIPILTEVQGIVKYGDIVEAVTMEEKLDEVTGLSRRVVIESRDPSARPRISIKDPKTGETRRAGGGENMARYFLPVGANIIPTDGQTVEAGEIIAKIPRETTKTKDITGGLPRVAELFEARKPKDHAIISEIDGIVTFGKDTKGKRKVMITPEVGEPKEYLISKGKHLTVKDGDHVRAGEPLMDGPANPHDILKVKGEKELAAWLVDEIQQVYRLQGVAINDKHIEVIVRQMLRRVRIKETGDTRFLPDEQVEKTVFERENERVIAKGGQPAVAEPLLLGITKASLSTESFISASSFQETTKVLTEAAISGKVDELRGLKENVIMGRLLPAGTGLGAYNKIDMVVDDDAVKPLAPTPAILEPEPVAAAASEE
ncbi:MAG: DNA-directed RNA polymerase subunit beta', partial [Deltaproteobacteria bacterium]|nr:DNA-directed RNA polymerase subunit beta' [Deltaproteobacteria bacterium]